MTSWQIDRETIETVRVGVCFFFWGGGAGRAPKSLQMLTAAMKLKDPCSLEEKI